MTYLIGKDRGWNQKIDTSSAADSIRFNAGWARNQVGVWSVGDAVSTAVVLGPPRWGDVPYVIGNTWRFFDAWPTDEETFRKMANDKIARKYAYNAYPASSHPPRINNLKRALANGHVFVFQTGNYAHFMLDTIKNDPNLSYDDPYVGTTVQYADTGGGGSHAMTITGYNDSVWCDINKNNVADPGEHGAFVIVNSGNPQAPPPYLHRSGKHGRLLWAYDLFFAQTQVPGFNIPNRKTQGVLNSSSAFFTAVTRGPNFKPTLAARFRIAGKCQSNVLFNVGIGDRGDSLPDEILPLRVFQYSGRTGSNAKGFSGQFSAPHLETLSVYLDYTDLIGEKNNFFNAQKRYFVMLAAKNNDTARILDFTLLDHVNNRVLSAGYIPGPVTNDTACAFVDYNPAISNLAPELTIDGGAGLKMINKNDSLVLRYDVKDDLTSKERLYVVADIDNNRANVIAFGSGVRLTQPDYSGKGTVTLFPSYDYVSGDKGKVYLTVYDEHWVRSSADTIIVQVVNNSSLAQKETIFRDGAGPAVFPNPFNPRTTLTVNLFNEALINIGVYDVHGKFLRSLANGMFSGGKHVFYWNGTDQDAKPCANGVYCFKTVVGGKEFIQKAILAR